MAIETPSGAFIPPAPAEQPINYQEVLLATGITVRVVYEAHDNRHPHSPEVFEGTEHIFLEETPRTFGLESRQSLAIDTLEPAFDEVISYPSPGDTIWFTKQKVEERRGTQKFILGDIQPDQTLMVAEHEERKGFSDVLERTGLSALALTALVGAVYAHDSLSNKETISRRTLLRTSLVSAAVAGMSLSKMFSEADHSRYDNATSWQSIHEEDFLRKFERTVLPVYDEFLKINGVTSLIIGFRNLLMAERAYRLSLVAKNDGEKKIALVVGAAHFQIEECLKLPQRVRMKAIEEYLVYLERSGSETTLLRESLIRLPYEEFVDGKWIIKEYQFNSDGSPKPVKV